MIDGKVCNAITSTSSAQKCYICGATPKLMNDLAAMNVQDVNPQNFRFGLSTLHAYIRFFECFLHIGYRIDFKKWQVREESDKILFKQKKEEIQKAFREQLGLLVDYAKPGGSGNSNDGNTARRFFRDYELSAKILNINEDLINRCGTLLEALSSGFNINISKFENFARETAKLYVSLYNWFPMPVTVHKILIHGTDIIQNAILPIGQLSEEAQESRNKDLKAFRRGHTRKHSRLATMEDLFNLLLVSSDPVISSMTNNVRISHRRSLPHQVLELLNAPTEEETVLENLLSASEESTSEVDSDINE